MYSISKDVQYSKLCTSLVHMGMCTAREVHYQALEKGDTTQRHIKSNLLLIYQFKMVSSLWQAPLIQNVKEFFSP